ncbi:MAG: hypothetical protein WCE75_09225, partial [Terracidiphilus sp.]
GVRDADAPRVFGAISLTLRSPEKASLRGKARPLSFGACGTTEVVPWLQSQLRLSFSVFLPTPSRQN